MVNKLDAYHEYIEAEKNLTFSEKIADYNWAQTKFKNPNSFAYGIMLQEHPRELSNIINKLARLIHKMETWEIVMNGKSDQEKFDIIVEFIDDIATIAINLPKVIKARFIFSVAHLSNQANRSNSGWCDNLPNDNEIEFKVTDQVASKWRSYNKLKIAIEKIGNKKYQDDTDDFRNKYNHRYSPKIELGISNLVKRERREDIEDNKKGGIKKVRYIYSFGNTPPIKLAKIIKLLKQQHEYCHKALDAYKKLVTEQLKTLEEK